MAEAAYQIREFPHVEYRETIVGSQAYIAGTRLRVFHLVSLARSTGWDANEIAAHYGFELYGLDSAVVDEVLAFAAAHMAEIEEDIARNRSCDLAKARTTLPNVQSYEIVDLDEQQ